MRQVDPTTGALKLGTHTGELKAGQVYSGGKISEILFQCYMSSVFV